MKTFFNVITALLAAVGAVLLTMKIIDAVSRNDREKQRISLFKSKVEVAPPGRRSRLSSAAGAVSDSIADYRFDEKDDLFDDAAEAVKDFAEDAADSVSDLFDDISDAAEDIFEDIGELAEDAVEEAGDIIDDISEDDLDRILGGED